MLRLVLVAALAGFGLMAVECVTNSHMNAETIRVDGGIRMPLK